MTPGELSRIEDTLRRAYGDVLESLRRDGSSPELVTGFQPGRPGRPGRGFGRLGRVGSSRRLAPVAAAAAVAVIGLVAGLIVPGALWPAADPAMQLGYVVTTGAVVPVDLATGVAQPPITFPAQGGAQAAAITPSGQAIYVATYQRYLIPVSTVTGKAGRPIRIGWYATQIVVSPDGSTAYLLEPSRGVAVVNLATNTAAGFIKMPSA
ncbi:MAG TPA: hypothetical protein VMA72_03740 [Streptosporangiaceae bacterium]|nr:hypothetical protein [Streptosporangiaceae bacterium]